MIDSAAASTPARAVTPRVAVLTLGGAVLRGPAGYATAAAHLRRRVRGASMPAAAVFDRQWSIGERRSVALLGLALRAQGLAVSGLHVRAALAEAGRARLPLVIRTVARPVARLQESAHGIRHEDDSFPSAHRSAHRRRDAADLSDLHVRADRAR